MKQQIPINLNHTIKVKLTDLGKEIYKHQYDKISEFLKSNGAPPLVPHDLHYDKDGYVRFQLWSFMGIFGKYATMGSQPFIEKNTMIYEYEPEKK